MTASSSTPLSAPPAIVLVTGPSGAGRSTAINALEDLGYEVIDNLPLSLLPRLLDGPPLGRPLALGLDVRNRDFGTNALIAAIDQLVARPDQNAQVLYLEADRQELVRRYSETRRMHPLAPAGSPLAGITRESELLSPVRARADILIDTTGMSPHDLRAEIDRWFAHGDGRPLGVTIHSFSYKRGLPLGMDIVIDCRFLRNPHWDDKLRALDGRDAAVATYVKADPRFDPFFDRLKSLVDLLLPAHKQEGKSHLSIGFGCTGGQHRSVTVTEHLASALADDGWHVSKRHREMERRDALGNKGHAV
ncbi:UPF0042 nucleotide-binding protein [Yoonia tamlensis]|uniref:UPF0042 nucleotide-binding protein n=1 Tax=Yoonia tamlensis TaxID=390270 RepID=A0A1I6HR58_9RHOB|nr:RNase adapter RapZ [Yoonia tamlensis]SFR56936.1 UPF0042 nucleotide-binding protein [Yoonia tamlensis]